MVAHPGDPDRGIPSDPTNGAYIEDLGEVKIDIAYAGSCTAGKVDDFEMYARVLQDALDAGEVAVQQDAAYRLTGSAGERLLERRRPSGWQSQYLFSLTPRALADFDAMCHWQQTAPASIFTRKSVCSMATPIGTDRPTSKTPGIG